MVRSHKSGVLVALLTSRTGGMVEDTPASMLSTEQPTVGDTKRRLVKSVLLHHLGATETAPGTREEDSAEIPRHHPTVKYRFHQFITLHCAVFLYFQKEDYDGNVGHILISLSAIYHFSRLFAESLQVNVICHVKM